MLRAQADELEASTQPDPAAVATEVVEVVAPAVAEVVANAAPTIEQPDVIDQAAASSLVIESESDARIREIKAQADAEIAIIEARARAESGVLETVAEVMPEPEVEEVIEPAPIESSDSDPAPPRRFLKGWFG